jgi:glycosyltransferase involved in cell wall biosynthesis
MKSMRDQDVTFCVCTYNSEKLLPRCLASIRKIGRESEILVVDHESEDATDEIAKEFGAEIIEENVGLGHARQVCFDNVRTAFLVFVDSDVEIIMSGFLEKANSILDQKEYGAVVGMAIGHRFAYGLPGSLLVLRKKDFDGKIVPDYIDARETFFIQNRLDSLHLKTAYIFNSMRHTSQFRKYKPEWEGANTRILPSPMSKELAFTTKVILLLTLNSRNVTNLLYLPIFYLKFLRGFLNPGPWLKIRRAEDVVSHEEIHQ